jgi:hypothetical protein
VNRRTLVLAAVVWAAPACVVIQENTRPDCHSAALLRLMAAAVPSASLIPCVRSLPLGWDYGSFTAGRGQAQFTLDRNAEDAGLLGVTLRPACDVGEATARPSDEDGARMFEPAPAGGSGYRRTIVYTFPGGCAVYRFSFPREPADGVIASVVESATFIDPDSLDADSG